MRAAILICKEMHHIQTRYTGHMVAFIATVCIVRCNIETKHTRYMYTSFAVVCVDGDNAQYWNNEHSLCDHICCSGMCCWVYMRNIETSHTRYVITFIAMISFVVYSIQYWNKSHSLCDHFIWNYIFCCDSIQYWNKAHSLCDHLFCSVMFCWVQSLDRLIFIQGILLRAILRRYTEANSHDRHEIPEYVASPVSRRHTNRDQITYSHTSYHVCVVGDNIIVIMTYRSFWSKLM